VCLDVRADAANDEAAVELLQKQVQAHNAKANDNDLMAANVTVAAIETRRATKCCNNGVICAQVTATFIFVELSTLCTGLTMGSYNPMTSSLEECVCQERGFTVETPPSALHNVLLNMSPQDMSMLPSAMQSMVSSAGDSLGELFAPMESLINSSSSVTFYTRPGATDSR
jgi:hypothetical protein